MKNTYDTAKLQDQISSTCIDLIMKDAFFGHFLLYIVKLSSLFKHKAYAFSQAGDGEDDCKFATAALKKIKPNLELAGISLARITDNYDIYSLRDEKEQFYKFKISLLGDDNILKREATALRSIPKNESFPSLVKQGVEHLGEDITYLLSKVKVGESVRDYGRSVLMHKIDEWIDELVNEKELTAENEQNGLMDC